MWPDGELVDQSLRKIEVCGARGQIKTGVFDITRMTALLTKILVEPLVVSNGWSVAWEVKHHYAF